MRVGCTILFSLLALLSACRLPPTPEPLALPTVTPSLVPLPPTFTPAPSSTPPLAPPTLNPADVAATAAAGRAQVSTAGVEPLCLRRQDVDADGEPEWLGLYLQPDDPPELRGFVMDGAAWYDLAPPESEEARGLGEYPSCELEVRDVNADGRVELLVWGRAGTSTDLLHIFAWDGTHYALLGAFEGEGGVLLRNVDGDLLDDVVVRLRPEQTLVREIVYSWDGAHYAWVWDRYAWFYPDRPHAYATGSPVHAVASYYLALNDRDLPGAYALLSPLAQAASPYQDWERSYATTLKIEVGATHIVAQDEGWAAVAAQVQTLDNVQGRVLARLYDVEWRLLETEAGWRLEEATTNQLDEWELSYYP